MQEINKKIDYLFSKINWKDSFLDAKAIDIMNNLKTDIERESLFDKAEQQFQGFIHRARFADDYYGLVSTMGLEAHEWERMKKEAVWIEELSQFELERIEEAVYSN